MFNTFAILLFVAKNNIKLIMIIYIWNKGEKNFIYTRYSVIFVNSIGKINFMRVCMRWAYARLHEVHNCTMKLVLKRVFVIGLEFRPSIPWQVKNKTVHLKVNTEFSIWRNNKKKCCFFLVNMNSISMSLPGCFNYICSRANECIHRSIECKSCMM